MKALRLKMRLYNNRLVRAREQLELSQAEAARQIGISSSQLSELESLKPGVSALGAKREWRPVARQIADFYGLSPEWLWPEEIAMVRRNALTLELAAEDAVALRGETQILEIEAREIGEAVRAALAKLPARERLVIRRRFGFGRNDEHVLEDAGAPLGISPERTRQIEQSAFKHLRREIVVDPDEGVRAPVPRFATAEEIDAALERACSAGEA